MNTEITDFTDRQTNLSFPSIDFSSHLVHEKKQATSPKSSYLIFPFALMGLMFSLAHIKYYIFSFRYQTKWIDLFVNCILFLPLIHDGPQGSWSDFPPEQVP